MEKVRSSRGPLRAYSTMLLLSLVLVACGTGGPADDGTSSMGADGSRRPSVVATTTILADMAGEIAGDAAEVSALIPAGSDPHNFEASARQLVQLQEADLVVTNGADFEEQLQQALTEAARAGVPVFRATDHIDTLTTGDTDAGAGAVDPHFWQDPARAADVVRALGTEIAALADDPAAVERRATDYARLLEDLDREIEDLLAGVPDDERTLVTNHAAFAYFADRFDFTIVGTVIPSVSTGAEPSARDLEELADTMRRAGVTAVFTENTAPTQLAETLAQEVGTQVDVVQLYSDALDEEDPDAATYVDMLRTNARRIGAALGA